jgi:hypothetical protein
MRREDVGTTVGIPKRQAAKPQEPKDDLDHGWPQSRKSMTSSSPELLGHETSPS